MSHAAVLLSLLAAATAAAGAPATAPQRQDFLLAGDEQALWLVRPAQDGKSWQVLRRPAGGTWAVLSDDIGPGRPTNAAAVRGNLHLLVRQPPGYLIFPAGSGQPELGLNPEPNPLWPPDVALAAFCPSAGLGPTASSTVIAVVPGPPALASTAAGESTPASTQASPADSGLALAVFQNAMPKWTLLTQSPPIRRGPQGRLLAAVAKGTLYVLVANGEPSLLAWDAEGWRSSVPAGLPPADQPIAAPAFADRLTLLLAGPAAQADKRQALLAIFDPAEGRFSLVTVIAADGQPFLWNAAALPQAARLGDRIALVWPDGQALTMGLCDALTGRMVSVAAVQPAETRPAEPGGRQALGIFSEIVLVATLMSMFLLRPRGLPRPFVLPAQAAPAGLARRILAWLIDMIPFALVGSLLFPVPPPPPEIQSASDLLAWAQRQMDSLPLASGAILSLLLYASYSTLMEWQLGATLGKRLMRLRVLGEAGPGIGLRAAVVRNLWRLTELSVLPLLLVMLLSPYRRRLGDIMARTAVVDARSPIVSPPHDDQPPPQAE